MSSDISEMDRKSHRQLKKGILHAHKLIAASNYIKDDLIKLGVAEEKITVIRTELAERYKLPYEETSYLVDASTVQKDMYRMEDDSIEILFDDGSSKDISQVSDMLNVELLSKKVRKHYLCYQR